MEDSILHTMKKSAIYCDKMNLTVINRYPESAHKLPDAIRGEVERKLFQIYRKYDGSLSGEREHGL